MRIQSTGHQHTIQVLNAAAQPTGVVNELLDAAHAADGGLFEAEIGEILNTPELGVDVEVMHH